MNDPLGLFTKTEDKDPLGLFTKQAGSDPLGLFTKEEKPVGFWNEVGRVADTAVSDLAKMAVTGPNLMLGGVARKIGDVMGSKTWQDFGDETFRRMEETQGLMSNDDNRPRSLPGKVAAGVAPVAAAALSGGGAIPSLVLGGFGTQGQDLVKQGVDSNTASGVAAIDTGLNLAGALIPGGRIVQSVANPVVGAGSDWINQQILKSQGYKDVAEQYDPMNLERRLTDAATGAVLPPGLREKPAYKPDNTKGGKLDAELAAAKVEADAAKVTAAQKMVDHPNVPQGDPIARMAQDLGAPPPEAPRTPMTNMADTLLNREQGARDALDQQRGDAAQAILDARQAAMELEVKRQQALDFNAAERARQGLAPIPEREFGNRFEQDAPNGELFDQPDMVQARQPAQAEFGDWRIDENGMPIRADLSMDAQQAQRPLQKDMFVEESPEFAKMQETQYVDENGNWLPPETTKPWAESLDDMQRLKRIGAIKGLNLTHPMEAGGALDAAKLAANPDRIGFQFGGADPSLKPGVADFNAALRAMPMNRGKGGKQRGAIDPEIFKEGHRRLTAALSRLTDQPWLAERFPKGQYKTNSDGTPMVLLHGTVEDIEGPLRASNEQGLHAGNPFAAHYFTKTPGKRDKPYFRADQTSATNGRNASIHPMVLKEGNYPFIPHDAGLWSLNSMLRPARQKFPTEAGYAVLKHIQDGLAKSGRDPEASARRLAHLLDNSKPEVSDATWRKLLKDAGIDGFFYRNTAESSKALGQMGAMQRSDPRRRTELINKNLQDGTSFVTFDPSNLESIYGKGGQDHGPRFEVTRDTPKEGGGTEKTTVGFNVPLKQPYVPKGQRGKVLFPFGKKNEMEVLKANRGLGEEFKYAEEVKPTNEEFIAAHKDTPDIKQNAIQRLQNNLTKGGAYMAARTNSPLIKNVVSRFVEANGVATSKIRDLIHDPEHGLAPKLRNMNGEQRTEAFGALESARKAGTDLTPEMLNRAGFDPQQVDFIGAFQRAMKSSYENMTEAQKASGLDPVDPIVAYISGMSHGDFRTLIHKRGADGKAELDSEGLPIVAGIFGRNKKFDTPGLKHLGLDDENLKFHKWLDAHPEYILGEERYFGGTTKSGMETGHMEMLSFLSKNDPLFKKYMEGVDTALTGQARDYMNAKKHTMHKKGVFGMEGSKPWEDAATNAKQGLEAQLKYIETVAKWSEMAKAVADTKELRAPDNGLDMPNAKAYLDDYVMNALGQNPKAVGQAVTKVSAEMGKALGVGTSIGTNVGSTMKAITNGILLGFVRTPFLLSQAIQPFKTAPEMKFKLQGDGYLEGSMISAMGKASMDAIRLEKKLDHPDKLIEGAQQYGEKHHLWSSNLFENQTQISNNLSYRWEQGTQFWAGTIESKTRQVMYFAYTRMLAENGVTPEQGLYRKAAEYTDMQLNNYSHLEQPMMYNQLGSAGRFANNLMSYKHNELSRIANFIDGAMKGDSGSKAHAKALAANLMSQVAVGGLMGTILYQEAEWLIKTVSGLVGKPISLTKFLLEHSDATRGLAYGASSAGVDMTGSMGMGPVVSTSPFPGGAKLADIASAGLDMVKNPLKPDFSEMKMKRFIREAAPGAAQGILDKAWYTKTNPETGGEQAINRNTLKPTADRNEVDSMAKWFSATGTNESMQKKRDWANKEIEMWHEDKQRSVVKRIGEDIFSKGEIKAGRIQEYFDAGGDPTKMLTMIERIAKEQQYTPTQLQIMKDVVAATIPATQRLVRQGVMQ